jgi:hypothetical protein
MVMLLKTMTSLAFVAACVTAIAGVVNAQARMAPGDEVVTNGPQSSGVGAWGWSPQQNVIESHRYDRLVETNLAFRQARIRKECGPITDPQLHTQCVASFNQDEPLMYGSSTTPYKYDYRSNAGS